MQMAEPGDELISLYTDGGANPNPGPAAIAFLIVDERGKELAETRWVCS
jgi:ribonuclease HI